MAQLRVTPLPPSSGSPEFALAVGRIAEGLQITTPLAEIAFGLAHGLSEQGLSEWLDITRSAVHERRRRLYQKPGLSNPQVVARRVGGILDAGT